ncbi:MAG: hypothetical protein K2J42_00350 [Muribaculaceae bacterium]|nr:hypothetical protein [Muribaculaceae bacterium]
MFKKLINIFKSVQSGEGIDSLMESADKLTDKFTSKLDKMFEDAAPSSDKKKHLGQKYSSATSSRSKDDEDRIAQLEARIRQMEQSAKNENSVKDVKSDSLTIKKEIEWNYWRDLESYFHLPKLEFRFRFWYCDKEEKKKRNLENIEHIESGDLRYCLDKGFITAPPPMALFSDGKIRYIPKVGDTLREVKAFATLIGYPIPDKAKTAILAAEIVREKGCDGVCIYSNQILYPSGRVCKVGAEVNFDKLVDEALEESNWFRIPERPSFNGLTPEQCLEKYTEFRNAIVPNPQLSTDEVLKQYNEAVDTWKKKNPDAAWT